MRARKLQRFLAAQGCRLGRHGGGHDVWRSPDGSRRASVPRHVEIDWPLVRAICRQLEIPPPPEK